MHPLRPEMLREQGHIFEMQDLGRGGSSGAGKDDFDHIEAKGRGALPQSRQIGFNCPAQNLLLAPINRMIAGHQRPGRACLDFNEHQHLGIPAHQVEFIAPIAGVAPVARHHGKASFPAEPCGGQTLTGRTGVVARLWREKFLPEAKHAMDGARGIGLTRLPP